ncbi:MAG: hypothetical protein ACI4RN_08985 [Oscillospiraceae bacterium]
MSFKTVEGIEAVTADKIHSSYEVNENEIYSTVSAEIILPLVNKAVKALDEPLFFFIEIPCSEEEEEKFRSSDSDPLHYSCYYLDNCTTDVALAIVKRYGDLLLNDGFVRYGFGSLKTYEEIYCQNYQVISVYGETEKFTRCFEQLDIPKEDKIIALWDTFSEENPGIKSTVEVNGETIYDIVENLKPLGLYFAKTVED